MIDTYQAFAIIAVAAVCTFITRFVPFALFGRRRMPAAIADIAAKLPPAIIAILVIYCIKDVGFDDMPKLWATAIAIPAVVLLHLWRREILISIGGGTVLYMVLLHFF